MRIQIAGNTLRWRIGLAVVVCLVAICVGIWFLMSDPNDASASLESSTSRKSSTSPPSEGTSAAERRASNGEVLSAVNSVPASFDRDYLENAANRSVALHALWRLTREQRYLDALKERITVEPEASVLLAIEYYYGKKPTSQYVEYLRAAAKAFPENALIAISLAGAEAELGFGASRDGTAAEITQAHFDAAIEALRRVTGASGDFLGSVERQQAMRDWLSGRGASEDNAWKKAWVEEVYTQAALAAFLNNYVAVIQQAKKTGNWDSKVQLAGDLYTLSAGLNPSGDVFESPNRSIRALELRALEMFPPNTPYGDAGLTTGKRIDQIHNDMVGRDGFIKSQVYPFLQSAEVSNPALYTEFLKRKDRDGVSKALLWVKGMAPKTAKAP